MSMKKEFAQQFKAARKVGVPIIQVTTHDAKATIANVRNALGQKQSLVPLIRWDVCRGAQPLTDSGTQQLAHIGQGQAVEEWSANLAEVLRRAENFEKDVILFISNAQLFWDAPEVQQGIWNLREPNKNKGNMLVLLTTPGTNLPILLQQDTLVLDEPLPTREQLTEIVTSTFKFAKQRNPEFQIPDESVTTQAVDALIGLPAFPAEQTTALNLNVSQSTLDVEGVYEKKRLLVNQTPGLSWYTGDAKLEHIGGLNSIKEFMHAVLTGKKKFKMLLRIEEIEKMFAGAGTDTSGVTTKMLQSFLTWMQDRRVEGIIEYGVPGVSKSQLVYAIANHYKIPCIDWNMSAMENSLVGASQANLNTAQKVMDAISDGSILALASCNGVDSLATELKRRFNLGIFFFDVPTASERAAIWKIYLSKFGIPEEQLTGVNDSGWTGAEIEQCCIFADRFNLKLEKAAKYIVPITVSSREKIRALRHNAHEKYLSASHDGYYQFTESQTAVEVEGRRFQD